jgi:hypothetical protein
VEEAGKKDKLESCESNESVIDDSLVLLLSDQTGIPPEDIKSIFEHSKGDLHKLVDVIKDVAPCYIAVKGKFQPRKKDDLRGAFCLVAQGVTGEILALKSWIGSQNLPESFDIKAAWESVFSYIDKLEVVRGDKNYRRLEDLLYNFFNNTTINKLFSKKLDLNEVQKSLSQVIMSVFKFDLMTEINVEKFNEIRFKLSPLAKKDVEEMQPKGDEEKGQEQIVQAITLNCIPMLDAINGKAVADLRENDTVEVSISSSSPVGKFINELFLANKLIPAFKVKSIQTLPSGDYLVHLFISDGVDGVFKSSGELKVKVSNENIQQKKPLYPLFLVLIVIIVIFLFFMFRR